MRSSSEWSPAETPEEPRRLTWEEAERYARDSFDEIEARRAALVWREAAEPEEPRWAVDHPGMGVLEYPSEAEARVAAGTAGRVIPPGERR